MKTIVVSAVNLNKGGTLTILRDCMRYLSGLAAAGNYRVVALVYSKELVHYPHIEYIEMQWPKRNWINRLWCEYVTMKGLSLKLSAVYLWISLHDTTPTVIAQKRVVYCHNSFPFYKWRIHELLFAPKVVFFALFTKYAYKKNIHENKYVIVQQQWLRDKFVRLFKLKEQDIIVAPPSFPQMDVKEQTFPLQQDDKYKFLFAATADSHKNFECICRAVQLLEKEMGKEKFEVYITVKGNENSYAKWLFRRWGQKASSLHFTGYMNKEMLFHYYDKCNCLIFPSKIETWGLPITEFAHFKKPMLLADLPYAHETAGGLKKIAFFNPDSPQELATEMRGLILGNHAFLATVSENNIASPLAETWQELFNILLK